MAEIVLEGVRKVFRDGTEAVTGLDLEIADGELFVLVGPSGCGKTTVLRMVAGLEDVTEGSIWIGDRVINDVPPGERDLAMVFQNYALYPHMTVFQNVALSLKIRKIGKEEIQRRVRDTARILRLEELLAKRPRELSGGERQRVAMGRAIVRQPRAFLMDEPLSNLDAKLRVQMRSEILRLQQDLRVTTLYVTHDQTEAMTLGDRVAVMKRGALQQVDGPQTLYGAPTNLFVAGFIGSPAMNIVEAKLVESRGDTFVEFGPHRLQIPAEVRSARPALARFTDHTIALGIRPEDIEDAAFVRNASPDSRLPAIIDLREEMGSEVFLHFDVDAPPVLTDDIRELAVDRGSGVLQELQEQVSKRRSSFVARVNRESAAKVAEKHELLIDTRKLYFFDPATGEAIYGDRAGVSVGSSDSPTREGAGA